MNILITGGCGFIGSAFVRHMLRQHTVVNLDKLTYAANRDSVSIGDPCYHFVEGDICDKSLVRWILDRYRIEAVVNFAAESHVDRSLQDCSPFIQSNVTGVQVLLDESRRAGIHRFLQVSTDEVYGTLGPTGSFTEDSPLAPNSPYAASKAAADCLVRSYCQSYGFPGIITRCSNNYGPLQFPEKLIPLFVSRALADESLPVYGTGQAVRDWIHVSDHVRGIEAALLHGSPGEVYNFGGRSERTALEIAHLILAHLGKPLSLIEFVDDRPGHDMRYAVDCSKAERELNWRARVEFDAGLRDTIRWYQNHPDFHREPVA